MKVVMVVMDHQDQDRLPFPQPEDMTILQPLIHTRHIVTMHHQGTIISKMETILLGVEYISTLTLVMMEEVVIIMMV